MTKLLLATDFYLCSNDAAVAAVAAESGAGEIKINSRRNWLKTLIVVTKYFAQGGILFGKLEF